MPEANEHWSICPIEDCEYAQEYDPATAAFCPECGMELLSECPSCKLPINDPIQVACRSCGQPFKE
jgi:hypothetical protein